MRRKLELKAKGEDTRQPLLPIERAYLEAIRDASQDPYKALTKLRALVALYPDPQDPFSPVGECLESIRREIDQLRQPADKAKAESLAVLDQRLERAEELQRLRQPAAAKAIRQAIIQLYQDKPWAAEKVQQARMALDAEAAKKETQKQVPQIPNSKSQIPNKS
jgi:hypothetical protein